MRIGRHLAPLLGAAMAGVAAASLVLFSVLAERTALDDPGDRSLRPRGSVTGSAPERLTIVPSNPSGSSNPEASGVGGTSADVSAVIRAIPVVAVEPTPASPQSAARDLQVDTVEAVASLQIPREITVDVTQPLVDVAPTGAEPPDGDTEGHAECPGRPDGARAKGAHPHGGPPACGNPHGSPPGREGASSDGGPSAAPERSKDPGGGSPKSPAKHGTPDGPGREAHEPKPKPEPERGPSGEGQSGKRTAPGHAKKDDGHPGHPHGGPPGRAKKGK